MLISMKAFSRLKGLKYFWSRQRFFEKRNFFRWFWWIS